MSLFPLPQTRLEWQNVFVIASTVHYTGVVFYAIFASGEQQEWADPESTSEDKRGIIGEDELADDESEPSCDSSLAAAARQKSYGAVTADQSGRKQGWKKKRGVTTQEDEEDEEGQNHYENGNFQENYQWHWQRIFHWINNHLFIDPFHQDELFTKGQFCCFNELTRYMYGSKHNPD